MLRRDNVQIRSWGSITNMALEPQKGKYLYMIKPFWSFLTRSSLWVERLVQLHWAANGGGGGQRWLLPFSSAPIPSLHHLQDMAWAFHPCCSVFLLPSALLHSPSRLHFFIPPSSQAALFFLTCCLYTAACLILLAGAGAPGITRDGLLV